jgi:hypothetical protein
VWVGFFDRIKLGKILAARYELAAILQVRAIRQIR